VIGWLYWFWRRVFWGFGDAFVFESFENLDFGWLNILFCFFMRMGVADVVPSHRLVVELFGFLVWVVFQVALRWGK
jgi:hypothetical protein